MPRRSSAPGLPRRGRLPSTAQSTPGHATLRHACMLVLLVLLVLLLFVRVVQLYCACVRLPLRRRRGLPGVGRLRVARLQHVRLGAP